MGDIAIGSPVINILITMKARKYRITTNKPMGIFYTLSYRQRQYIHCCRD